MSNINAINNHLADIGYTDEQIDDMTTAEKILAPFAHLDTNQLQHEAASAIEMACMAEGACPDPERHAWVRYTFRDYSEIVLSLGIDGTPYGWSK